MKPTRFLAAVILSTALSCGSAQAQSRPGGCLKYGLGGAIAGHFAGGERLRGAIAGCALGMYRRRQYEREVRERNQSRNRTAERSRSNARATEDDRWTGERSPYEDLGLGLPTGGEQVNRPQGRTHRPGGFESGGSFARSQVGAPAAARVPHPEQTGALRRSGPAF